LLVHSKQITAPFFFNFRAHFSILYRRPLTHKGSFFIFNRSWNHSLFLQVLSKRRSLVFDIYNFLDFLNFLRLAFKKPHRVYNLESTMGTTRKFEDVIPAFFQHSNGYGNLHDFRYGGEFQTISDLLQLGSFP
jgi:hypothetical protein